MLRKLFLVAMAMALLVWVAGCSKNPVQPQANSSNISQQFDGLNTNSEQPGFGDPTIANTAAQETAFNDPMAASPKCDSLLRDPNAGMFHFRAVWGRLHFDSMVTTPTNWEGSLTLSRGVEIVRRTIGFEPMTDSILPRTQLNIIDWASQTTVASDGIAVDLLIPRMGPTVDTTTTAVVDSLGDTTFVIHVDTIPAAPVTLEFKTGPYTRTFTLAELIKLDTIVNLDDSNAIAFSAFRVDHIACPRGFLTGVWGFDSTGTGTFRGTWMSKRGLIVGSLDGHFKVDSLGDSLFFGKWIDMSGAFQGLLRGSWGLHPNEHASERGHIRGGGWFSGHIFDANANPIGELAGKFKGINTTTAGFFQGRWKINCAGLFGDREDDGMEDHPDHSGDDHGEHSGGHH